MAHDSDDPGAARRPGGRTARTTAAVHAACLRLLAERGARGFGMEDLAREAGIHKTTLYRRWASMGELLAEVAADAIGQEVPVPDTGALAGDLAAMARSIAGVLRDPVAGPALTALFTAPRAMREVDGVVRSFWEKRIREVSPVAKRAISRGELPPGSQGALLFECLGAPLYYRALITHLPVDDAAIERSVRITLAAGRAGAFRPTRS